MPILRTVGAVGGVASFLAAGKITAKQLPIATGQGKRTDTIRVAPGFAVGKSAASGTPPPGAYTVDALAKFLGGECVDDTGHASFKLLWSRYLEDRCRCQVCKRVSRRSRHCQVCTLEK